MTRHHIMAAALAIVVGSAAMAEARPGGRGQRGPGDGRRAMAAELNLTEDQRATLQGLHEEVKARMDEIRAQVQAGDLSREEARGQAQGIREEFRSDRQSVFTTEQLALIETHRAEARVTRESRERGAGPLGQLLELTEAQKEQLQTMREEHRNAAQALRESGEATREDLEQLRSQHREQVEAVLTGEQRQQLEELRAQRAQDGEGKRERGRRGRGPHGFHPPGELPPDGDGGPVVTESAVTAAPTAVTGESWGSLKAATAP